MSIKNMDRNIYRIIKPYQSNKVYEAKTTMHGAGKCYKELKSENVICNSFTIQNLADNTTYDFRVDSKPKLESLIIHSDSKNSKNSKIQKGGLNMEIMENRLRHIETRLLNLENKLTSEK